MNKIDKISDFINSEFLCIIAIACTPLGLMCLGGLGILTTTTIFHMLIIFAVIGFILSAILMGRFVDGELFENQFACLLLGIFSFGALTALAIAVIVAIIYGIFKCILMFHKWLANKSARKILEKVIIEPEVKESDYRTNANLFCETCGKTQ